MDGSTLLDCTSTVPTSQLVHDLRRLHTLPTMRQLVAARPYLLTPPQARPAESPAQPAAARAAPPRVEVGLALRRLAHDMANIIGASSANLELMEGALDDVAVGLGQLERELRLQAMILDAPVLDAMAGTVAGLQERFARAESYRAAAMLATDQLTSTTQMVLAASNKRDPATTFHLLAVGTLSCAVFDAKATEMGVVVDVDGDRAAVVKARRSDLVLVLVNLIKNSAEALASSNTSGKKKVNVEVRQQGGSVRMAVEDNGPGIPPEKLAGIFNDGESTKANEGRGLGLGSCRELVALSGGELTVESKVGVGTKFTLTFPSAAVRDDPASAPADDRFEANVPARVA